MESLHSIVIVILQMLTMFRMCTNVFSLYFFFYFSCLFRKEETVRWTEYSKVQFCFCSMYELSGVKIELLKAAAKAKHFYIFNEKEEAKAKNCLLFHRNVDAAILIYTFFFCFCSFSCWIEKKKTKKLLFIFNRDCAYKIIETMA